MSGRRPAGRESRVMTFFLLLGCCSVLGGTFAAGVYSGRHWPGLLPSVGATRESTTRETAARGIARSSASRAGLGGPAGDDKMRAPEAPPVLTFYQELTAPLTAPPPATKPRSGERSSERSGRTDLPRAASPRAERPSPFEDRPVAERPTSERRFTVQVGAFRTPEQAEALRSKVAAAGHDAYVTEVEGSTGARYRVRAGTFVSRDEARQAAERIGAVVKLSTYVTLR